MHFKTVGIITILLFGSCDSRNLSAPGPINIRNNSDVNRVSDIPLTEGYVPVPIADSSFGAWLRLCRLKKDKTVYLFDGTKKQNQEAQYAVLDISVGEKDLQQCADAVMRLRAEYLFEHKRFAEIKFFDNNKKEYAFNPPYSYDHLLIFLDVVFGMCGSASLSKQLKPVTNLQAIAPGDVLIRGGFPGHAATVMDVAVNRNGEKIFLLSQSYMPAQDIHVLLNPTDDGLSPWFALTDAEMIITPEFVFKKTEWMTW